MPVRCTLLILLATIVGTSGCPTAPPPPVANESATAKAAAPDADPDQPVQDVGEDLSDDPRRFIESAAYRRAVMVRDLVDHESGYAQVRYQRYARADGGGWDRLPTRDWPSVPVTREMARRLANGQDAGVDQHDATSLVPDQLPETDAEWIELGRRVFFEYPVRGRQVVQKMFEAGRQDQLPHLVHEDTYVGLRLAFDNKGRPRIASTCATCHASIVDGEPSGILSNREFDLGVFREFREAHGLAPDDPVDVTLARDVTRLGPGRSDVLRDDEFNPYAFPDFGGIKDLPFLHHTGSWHHRGVATLAIRVETVYNSALAPRARFPRVLAWALAKYLRSLPPPSPLHAADDQSARGQEVFETEGCDTCHVPPLYTSDKLVPLAEIGTDPAAGSSSWRYTGGYRVPSLRGVGRAAPYLHHGAFSDLEAMFDPKRKEPGHPFGLEVSAGDRADLLRFLRTL